MKGWTSDIVAAYRGYMDDVTTDKPKRAKPKKVHEPGNCNGFRMTAEEIERTKLEPDSPLVRAWLAHPPSKRQP